MARSGPQNWVAADFLPYCRMDYERSFFWRSHRAMTALRAASLRSSGVIAAALAKPPFFPPLRPSATAAGFFLFVMPQIYLTAHAKTSCIILRRSRIIGLMMNTREQRALEIANHFPITAKNGTWTVPSQSGSGKYAV